MGLNVYLYKYENYDECKKALRECDAAEDKIWDDVSKGRSYNDLSDDEKDLARSKIKAVKERLGVKDFHGPGETQIELPSTLFPDHYFKIGYFRSSYNDTGINRVLGNLIGISLGHLFPNCEEEYEFQPNWKESLKLTEDALKKLRAKLETEGAFSVFKVGYNEFLGHPNRCEIKSEADALKTFLEDIKTHNVNGEDHWFHNKNGDFFLGNKTPKVRAIISGVKKRFFIEEHIPCSYVVVEAEDKHEWYVQALEIVKETCEWVLKQPDIKKYWLHWSG